MLTNTFSAADNNYSFTARSKNEEVCVGILKVPKIHEKSPPQHAGDLEILESIEELHAVFFNESGCSKWLIMFLLMELLMKVLLTMRCNFGGCLVI